MNLDVLGFSEEQRADSQRHYGNADGIPESKADVAGGGDHGGSQQRQHAPEPAVAYSATWAQCWRQYRDLEGGSASVLENGPQNDRLRTPTGLALLAIKRRADLDQC